MAKLTFYGDNYYGFQENLVTFDLELPSYNSLSDVEANVYPKNLLISPPASWLVITALSGSKVETKDEVEFYLKPKLYEAKTKLEELSNLLSSYGEKHLSHSTAEIDALLLGKTFGDHNINVSVSELNLHIYDSQNLALIEISVPTEIKFDSSTIKTSLYDTRSELKIPTLVAMLFTHCTLENEEITASDVWTVVSSLKTSASIYL